MSILERLVRRRRYIGERLRIAIERAGMTQEQVAAALEGVLPISMSQQTVSEWVTGNRPLRSEFLVEVCDVLGCSINDLFGELDEDRLGHIVLDAIIEGNLVQWKEGKILVWSANAATQIGASVKGALRVL